MRYLFPVFLLFIFKSLVIGQDLSAITFNLRLDLPSDSSDSWPNRKDMVGELIKWYNPDILFTQEGLSHQIKFLDSTLVGYKRLGVGRDDGIEAGEFMTIHFKTEKYKLVANGYFWLSETPDKTTPGWDAGYTRYASWAVLEEKESTKQILTLNTHFDNAGELARKKSALLILDSISSLSDNNNIAVLFGGDLNAKEEEEPIIILSGELSDSYHEALNKPYGPYYTFNNFGGNKDFSMRIDYFFISDKLKITSYKTITDSWNEKYPSDHFPVYIELEYK